MINNEEPAVDLEQKIKRLEDKLYNGAINTGGGLNMESVLQFILKGDRRAKLRYSVIMKEYMLIKQHPDFAKKFGSTVKPETLKKITLYGSYIIRMSKDIKGNGVNGIFFGEIVKLPTVNRSSQFCDGEEWKALLAKKREVELGDQVIYSHKNDIVLDNETLHFVSYIDGKIKV